MHPRRRRPDCEHLLGLCAADRLDLAALETTHVDAALGQLADQHVMDLLAQVHAEFGATVVLVTHDPSVAARSPRTVTIRDGRVGSEGVHGREYAVVGRDGSLQLPPELFEELAAGTLLEIRRDGREIKLVPRSEEPS